MERAKEAACFPRDYSFFGKSTRRRPEVVEAERIGWKARCLDAWIFDVLMFLVFSDARALIGSEFAKLRVWGISPSFSLTG